MKKLPAPETAFILWLVLMMGMLALLGCATSERTISVSTWGPDHTTHTQAMIHEIGWQVAYGERHDVISAGDMRIGSDVTKSTIGAMGGAAIGVAGGYLMGGLPGAVIGGAGGAAVGTIDNSQGSDAPTAAGAVLAQPAIKDLTPEITPLLKSYITAHPESCKLVPILGLQGVLDLMDQASTQAK